MKRITYWAMSTITALVLLLGYHTSTSSTAASAQYAVVTPATGSSSSPTSSSSTSSGTSSSTSASSGGTSAPTSAASPTASSSGSSASSSTSSATTKVTGTAAETRYGPVQVQLTITGGKVTAVDVVEYPDGNGRDEQINAQALPILVSETLKAQSAKIDMVSGATYTSTGYLTSLQSALDQAGL